MRKSAKVLVFGSLSALIGCACAGSAPATLPQVETVPPAREPAAQTLVAELAAIDAEARKGSVRETIHGIEVDDPYRMLEADSPLTRAFITKQTARTRAALGPLEDPARRVRLQQLLSIGFVDSVAVAAERVFVTERARGREQAALFRLQADGSLGEPLLDPLDHGERAAIDWMVPSPEGRLVALGLSQNGDERSVLHVLDVDQGTLRTDRISNTKWSGIAWLPDESGFYYTRYPREGEDGYDAAEPDAYFPRVYFHRLGDDPSSDPRVFGSTTSTDFPYPSLSDDGRYLLVHNHRGWTASDVYVLDRGKSAAARVVVPDVRHPLTALVAGQDSQTSAIAHRGKLYLLTDIDAPRKRVMVAPAATAKDFTAFRELVPEGAGPIEDWAIAGDAIALHVIEDLQSRLRVLALDGRLRSQLALPTAGSVDDLSASPDHGRFAFSFSSYFYPPAVFSYEVATGETKQAHQVEHDLRLDDYVVSRGDARSLDGTLVPYQLVHRRDLERNASNPVLATGYGGFDVSLLPEFARSAIYWLERGGVYVVANLRGGGEHGEAWHRAGMLERKPHVFEDFEAVLRDLVSARISRPERIAISGGSNGGLLVAAVATRAPELVAAVVAQVGLYDMLRYPLFPPAALWISEYGDPSSPEGARYLHAYSPYHRVVEGTAYPAMLIQTAEQDTRVHWAHSTKLAARMQHAQSGARPIYFYMEQQQGHGRGTRLADLVTRGSRTYAFLEHELGMR